MTIAQVLAGAAKLVERGWVQYYIRLNGHYCAAGAIERVSSNISQESKAGEFFRNFLGQMSIVSWNDDSDRTGPEVATWLSSAAEWAKVRRE